ncbi:MAG: hypothetical protein HYW48_03675 [Deltaproteobacteria bacterium]|nr:hypothetical protein [Deltaproteobacteria bacterium]
MKVIWKRPDGFHEASPSDYVVAEISSGTKIWLHKSDHENYPFRVSGGWQDEDATRKLNQLVNLIDKPVTDWVQILASHFGNARTENAESFLQQQLEWIDELKRHLKGDTWEIEIMSDTLDEVKNQIEWASPDFLRQV